MKQHVLLFVLMSAGASLIATALLWAGPASATEGAEVMAAANGEVAKWAYVAAAATTVGSSLAAGYAVGRVGSAALGTLAEKPELFGRIIVLVGLAEGIAIYGLIISILILNQLG